MYFLIVGCGSIGKRHIGILNSLGVGEIDIVDPSKARREEVVSGFNVKKAFEAFDEALKEKNKYKAVFVCTPTSLHVPVAIAAAESGSHIFLEKPVSNNLEGVERLKKLLDENGLTLMVGYHLRFHPALKKVEELVHEQRIGHIYSVRAECGQYLPDWHPWEDYRKFYMSKKDLGGGAILDLSHELDCMRWLFGEVEEVGAIVDTISDLEIDSDDIAGLLLRFQNRIIATVHLDLLQRTYRRTCQIIGEKGTIFWDYTEKTIRVYLADTGWETFEYQEDKDSLYVNEVRHFLKCLEGKDLPPVDLESGVNTLKIVLGALRSSKEKRFIQL